MTPGTPARRPVFAFRAQHEPGTSCNAMCRFCPPGQNAGQSEDVNLLVMQEADIEQWLAQHPDRRQENLQWADENRPLYFYEVIVD
jgi:hypothetical protein